MKLTEFLNESDETYVASSSYQANKIKVSQELEKLRLNLMKHHAAYMNTDRNNWGFAGDMEHVYKRISELNEFLST